MNMAQFAFLISESGVYRADVVIRINEITITIPKRCKNINRLTQNLYDRMPMIIDIKIKRACKNWLYKRKKYTYEMTEFLPGSIKSIQIIGTIE